MANEVARVENKHGLQSLVQQMQGAIADVLPRHVTPERVAKMALVAASRQPKLYECTRESLAKSLMTASELGLDCSGTLGSGYLVPYWNKNIRAREAQFIIGYRGLIDLARRSGQISQIEAHVVYENDDFDIQYGTDPCIVHRPNMDGEPGEMKCVYAVAVLRDGTKQTEVMTRSQIDGIMRRSSSKDQDGNPYGPWVTDYTEMARKTVVRRLCKYLPLSAEMETALAAEDSIIDLPSQPIRQSLRDRLQVLPDAPRETEPEPGPMENAQTPAPDTEQAATGTETPGSGTIPGTVEQWTEILWSRARAAGWNKATLAQNLVDLGVEQTAQMLKADPEWFEEQAAKINE